MEVPVINRISGLEATVCTLHTPSFLSQLISLSGIDRIPRPSSFWKWSALVLLILASFGAMINKIKVWMIRFQKETSNPLLRPLLYDTDFDDSCSSCSSEDSDDDDEYDIDEDEEPAAREEFRSMADDRRRGGAVFAVKGFQNQWNQNGSSNLRQRRSIGEHLSELACSKSVVKLWENLGLGLGLELQGESNSFLDSGEERKSNLSSSSFLPPPSATTWSPIASVRLWDTRAASKKPAILAEWGSLVGNVDAIGYGGLTKLYLRDGGELAAVRDLRRAGDPLDNVTESDMEKWWPSLLTVMGRAGMALTPP